MSPAPNALGPHYRSFSLPWEADPEAQRRLRRLIVTGAAVLLVFGMILPFIHLPLPAEAPAPEVPDRLARLMVQERPKPPPPVPIAPPKHEVPQKVAKPVRSPKPLDRTAQAQRVQHAGLLQFADELADLRRDVDVNALAQTRNLSGAVGQASHAERSLITSRALAGSGAVVTTASASRGFGRGAGSLQGYQAAQVSSRIAAAAHPDGVAHGGSSLPSRTEEEIALVFDRNKGAIYALYGRALRDRPDLMGKLVLEFTIAPSGVVTECHVVASELQDPQLEQLIVARVKLFRFQAKNVGTMTTTKPIEFVPSG